MTTRTGFRGAAPRRRERLARYRPWGDETGGYWPSWRRLPRAAPFSLLYLAISWALFLPAARPAPGNVVVDTDRLRPFLYEIPDLSGDPLGFFGSMATAPWLNHNLVQLAYVTFLLLLVGVPFEAREGTARTMLVFFGTTLAGAVAAGLLLHLLYPAVWDTPFLRGAWERSWSGGSAGAFGLIGATAARARRPLPLLALVVLWEAVLVWAYLREWTPAFHLTALAVGFALARWAVRPPPAATTAPGAALLGYHSGTGHDAGAKDLLDGVRRMDEARREADESRRHESVDHAHPTDAGLLDREGGEVPGTGILGDETLVRDADGAGVPGLYPAPAAHTGGAAHPGPTPAAEDAANRG